MRAAWTVYAVTGVLVLSACQSGEYLTATPVQPTAAAPAAPAAPAASEAADPTATPSPTAVAVDARWADAYAAAYYAMEYLLEPEDLARIAARWGAAVTAQFGEGAVTADPALFAPWSTDGGWTPMLDNDVDVVGGDPAAVRAGLEAAAARFFLVDGDGVEHPWAEAEDPEVVETLIVAYVSPVEDDGTGLGYSIDTQGAGYPEAARTMMTILVEELERAGVVGARLVPIPD